MCTSCSDPELDLKEGGELDLRTLYEDGSEAWTFVQGARHDLRESRSGRERNELSRQRG